MCKQRIQKVLGGGDDIGEPAQNVGKVIVGKYLARIAGPIS